MEECDNSENENWDFNEGSYFLFQNLKQGRLLLS